jgi:predicted transcriptional regulator
MTWHEDRGETNAVRLVTQRLDFLERLATSPSSKRELVADLPYSRSTVDRAVRDLEIADLIEQTGDGYVTTLSGRVSAEQYRQFLRTTRDTVAVRDVVDRIPADAPVDGRLFRGANAHRANDVAPYDVVDHLVESLDGVDRLRTLSDGFPHPQYFDAVVERVEHGQLTVDGIVSDSLWQAFVDHHSDDLETMLDVGIDVRVGDVPPFTLHLLECDDETTIQLLVHGDTGGLRGIVANDTAEAVEWATALFEQTRDDARRPDDVAVGEN